MSPLTRTLKELYPDTPIKLLLEVIGYYSPCVNALVGMENLSGVAGGHVCRYQYTLCKPFYDKKMQRWKLLTYSTLTLSNPGGRPVDVIGALAAEEPLKSAFLGREDDLIFTDPERRI